MSDQVIVAIVVFLLLLLLILGFLFLAAKSLQRQRKKMVIELTKDLTALRLSDHSARLDTFYQFINNRKDTKFIFDALDGNLKDISDRSKVLEREFADWASINLKLSMRVLLFSRTAREEQDLFIMNSRQKLATLNLELQAFSERVDEAIALVSNSQKQKVAKPSTK